MNAEALRWGVYRITVDGEPTPELHVAPIEERALHQFDRPCRCPVRIECGVRNDGGDYILVIHEAFTGRTST